MDGFNEKSNEEVEQQQPLGCLHRFSKTIKIVIIGGLIIVYDRRPHLGTRTHTGRSN